VRVRLSERVSELTLLPLSRDSNENDGGVQKTMKMDKKKGSRRESSAEIKLQIDAPKRLIKIMIPQ